MSLAGRPDAAARVPGTEAGVDGGRRERDAGRARRRAGAHDLPVRQDIQPRGTWRGRLTRVVVANGHY